MLIAVRAEVESADHWKDNSKTHGYSLENQEVTLAHMLVQASLEEFLLVWQMAARAWYAAFMTASSAVGVTPNTP